MKWRTDTPTANVIVAKIKNIDNRYEIIYRYEHGYYSIGDNGEEYYFPIGDIEKWADLEEDETVTDIELIKKSWYRQGYIDGINKQEPQWILENLKYKENPKYGQPLETVTDYTGLADEIVRVSKRYPEVSFAKLSRIAKHFAKWGAEHLKTK